MITKVIVSLGLWHYPIIADAIFNSMWVVTPMFRISIMIVWTLTLTAGMIWSLMTTKS